MIKRRSDKFRGLLANPVIFDAYRFSRKGLRRFFRSLGAFLSDVHDKRKQSDRVDVLVYFFQFCGIVLIILSLCAACIFFQVSNRFDKSIYVVNIPRGYGAGMVGELLLERGIIDGQYGFSLIVNIFGLQDKMQAGTYEFTTDMSLLKIALKIRNGEVIPPLLGRVIFPEGMSIYKMSKLLERQGLSDGPAFRTLTEKSVSDRLLKKYSFLGGVPTDSLEGYLFPDTYLIQSDISASLLADLMLARFNQMIMPYWKKHRRSTKYDLHQILTLASIIEKEAAIPGERPTISSVYHNRLKIRMHLGADPTIKYVLERPRKIVSYDDLEVDSPYNTYKRYGLPPGPICNPGLESIKAAIYPAKTDYLYFVARADGSHIFSKTWEEHEKAKQLTRMDRIKKIYQR